MVHLHHTIQRRAVSAAPVTAPCPRQTCQSLHDASSVKSLSNSFLDLSALATYCRCCLVWCDCDWACWMSLLFVSWDCFSRCCLSHSTVSECCLVSVILIAMFRHQVCVYGSHVWWYVAKLYRVCTVWLWHSSIDTVSAWLSCTCRPVMPAVLTGDYWCAVNWATNQPGDNQLGDIWSTGRQIIKLENSIMQPWSFVNWSES